MPEEKSAAKAPHSLILENRMSLTVTGVSDVDSFDEQAVAASTSLGSLMIRGAGLEMERLDRETGELLLKGEISSITYTDRAPGKEGFFARIFR